MQNFNICPYTHIIFGKNQIAPFFNDIKKYGYKNILLLYGHESIHKIGLYDKVIKELKFIGAEYHELGGVDPNPRLSTVREGIKMCRELNIDFILAVGGGSTVDCSKAIALGTFATDDIWDIMYNKKPVDQVLPTGNILTLSATGSETNSGFVITNEETNHKLGYGTPTSRPKITLLDPTNTFSVNAYQTAAGAIDALAHILEQYFNNTEDVFITDRLLEGLAKTVVHYAPIAIENPTDYDARANLMWTSTLALNTLSGAGRFFEGGVHLMEHGLSAYYDVTHGIGLGILYPHYLRYALNDENMHRYNSFFKAVFNCPDQANPLDQAKNGIQKLQDFIKSLKVPTTIKELNIPHEKLKEIAASCLPTINHIQFGTFILLTEERILDIYEKSY